MEPSVYRGDYVFFDSLGWVGDFVGSRTGALVWKEGENEVGGGEEASEPDESETAGLHQEHGSTRRSAALVPVGGWVGRILCRVRILPQAR